MKFFSSECGKRKILHQVNTNAGRFVKRSALEAGEAWTVDLVAKMNNPEPVHYGHWPDPIVKSLTNSEFISLFIEEVVIAALRQRRFKFFS